MHNYKKKVPPNKATHIAMIVFFISFAPIPGRVRISNMVNQAFRIQIYNRKYQHFFAVQGVGATVCRYTGPPGAGSLPGGDLFYLQ
jgi:hypothetical protein